MSHPPIHEARNDNQRTTSEQNNSLAPSPGADPIVHGRAKVGYPAPDFTMPTTADLQRLQSRVSLAHYRGAWLVLFFYPQDFTFVYSTEILVLSDRYDEFVELGADVLGVSTASVDAARAWINTPRDQNGIAGLQFPVASDSTHAVSHDYGVLAEDTAIALRGLFIIDPQGILQYAVIHNANISCSVDETLRVLEALQMGGLGLSDWQLG